MSITPALFVKHSPAISSHAFEWLDVELADRKAMMDVENAEYVLFKYVRPNIGRKSKDETR